MLPIVVGTQAFSLGKKVRASQEAAWSTCMAGPLRTTSPVIGIIAGHADADAQVEPVCQGH